MPTYDYECSNCGKIIEIFHKINQEPPIKECPDCKGTLRRLIGCGTGLIFKGSGFYITDYKRKDNQKSQNTTADKNNQVKKNK
ncbi:MAG: zinc ribbon domain-containing protein [Candidatus Omnitrophica bacterium]|nr:zinc ribbon domain-containing protein [Candidatus Omnitrophota bacterium]MCM8831053.1 zinc ribbon domain-containing protein [Candidatus Omnitrophota bacterium]